MQGSEVTLVAQILYQGIFWLGGQRGLGVGRDVLEQLPGDLLLPEEGGNVESSHSDLGTRLPEADPSLGKHVKHIRVSTLGSCNDNTVRQYHQVSITNPDGRG